MFSAARHYSLPLLLALSLHLAAGYALYQGWHPEQELLNVITPRAVTANLLVLEPKAKPAPAPAPRPEPVKPQPQPQQASQQAQQQRERALAEAEREKKLAQEQAQEQAEQAEAERERQERLRRLSELAQSSLDQAIAEESADLTAGTEEAVVRSYHASIYDLVRRNWSRPPSARIGMRARLQVELIPTGEGVAVTVVESSGNLAFDRSAEHAVRRAKRFEVPTENALFEAHFRRFYIVFQPEDLLR